MNGRARPWRSKRRQIDLTPVFVDRLSRPSPAATRRPTATTTRRTEAETGGDVAGAASVTVIGEAGIGNVESLDAELQSVAGQNPQLVICDLSKLTYISSAGMEAFLRLRVSLAKHGGIVQLVF